jgi:precorrin-2/cobalt-factor-2 C20-methyltransferase
MLPMSDPILSAIAPEESQDWGTLWGIGVGPGDGEWLTLKGLRILQSVPVVALPQNNQGEPGMAYRIVQDYLQPHQTVMALELPFVTDVAVLQAAWQAAAAQLVPLLQAGQDVAFLAEGDISFYSTFTYVAQALRQQAPAVPIQSVPGVCSPLAAASRLLSPLAIASEKVVILPALYRVDDLAQALDWAEVVVLMKVSSVFAQVWHLLQERQLLAHASLVEWIGWPQEKIFPSLEPLQDYKPPYFSILIVRREPYGF